MSAVMSAGITERLAAFCVGFKYEDLSGRVIAAAKNAILDWLGVALIGSRQDSARILLKACAGLEGEGHATILGSPRQACASLATLANGIAGHALDYDDVQHRCSTHMSAPVLPVALALAETAHVTGKDLLTAYIVGFEIGCRLGRAGEFNEALHERGIHPTGFLGHFGAVAGAGKLLGLDTLQMRRAFGVVAGKAAGLLRSHGTMLKPMNAANAAHDGLLSAMLAKQGFTGPDDIFDGEHNIFSVGGGKTDPDALLGDLGKEFEITHNTFKFFACTGWRNPIAEALMVLSEQHNLKSSDVNKIDIKVNDAMLCLPNIAEPQTGLEGKFSVAHVAAVALIDRAAGIAQFSDERVRDADVAALRCKVTLDSAADLKRYQARVFVHTSDGRSLTHFVPVPKGDHQRPLTRDELVKKFRANAAPALPQTRADQVVTMIGGLESLQDVAELMRLCRTERSRQA